MSLADISTRQHALGQYMTTAVVADMMAGQISVPGPWRILDPACGDGNLLVAAIQEARRRGITVESVTGFDLDSDMISASRRRLAPLVGTGVLQLHNENFLEAASNSKVAHANVVLANPPYGGNREYTFFSECARWLQTGEMAFLLPLAFLDRISGLETRPLKGRPLKVTTGHAIVRYEAGVPFSLKSTRQKVSVVGAFRVLTGLKLYELGAGAPPQTAELIARRPYSSPTPRPGWLPCARTGDLSRDGLSLDRLWVDYGPHLAHPKDFGRFSGPRLFVRRVPLWKDRRLCAVYVEEPALAAGDLLVVKHFADDVEALLGAARFINCSEAADAIHQHRPTVLLRDSFPKISAKDLSWLLEMHEATP